MSGNGIDPATSSPSFNPLSFLTGRAPAENTRRTALPKGLTTTEEQQVIFWENVLKCFLYITPIRKLSVWMWKRSFYSPPAAADQGLFQKILNWLIRPSTPLIPTDYTQIKTPKFKAELFVLPEYFNETAIQECLPTLYGAFQAELASYLRSAPMSQETFDSLVYFEIPYDLQGERYGCRVALKNGTKKMLRKMATSEIHIGKPGSETPLSPDFIAVFSELLRQSTSPPVVHIHSPFNSKEDLESIAKAIGANASVKHLLLHLDKKRAEEVLPLMKDLLKVNTLEKLTLINTTSDDNSLFAVEDEVWEEVYIAFRMHKHPKLHVHFQHFPEMLLDLPRKVEGKTLSFNYSSKLLEEVAKLATKK